MSPVFRVRSSAPIAVAFITLSMGELHCLLPILWLAKEREPDLRIIIVFRNQRTRVQLEADPVYSAIVSDLGVEILSLAGMLRVVLPLRTQVRLIFKDFSPIRPGTTPPLLRQICPNASLVVFPHAYALYGVGEQRRPAEFGNTAADYDQENIDTFLVYSPLDVPAWSDRVDASRIRIVGATGYTQWWGDVLQGYAREHLKDVRDETEGKRLVLMTTRRPNKLSLTEDNYRYLLTEGLQAVLRYPDTVVMIKPHSREDLGKLQGLLNDFPESRVRVSSVNTFALASIAVLTLSFWSSAVMDSVAIGTPAIEFHRFHKPVPQGIVKPDGQIVSYYTEFGVALETRDRESLERALEVAFTDPEALLSRQREGLARGFPDNEERLDAMRGVLEASLGGRTERVSEAGQAAAWLRLGMHVGLEYVAELRRGHNAKLTSPLNRPIRIRSIFPTSLADVVKRLRW